ncbi:hypothetical protein IAT38_006165 [Cryptococcus sp. DSM 104549]
MSFWSDDDDDGDLIEDLTASQWVREPVIQAKAAGFSAKKTSSKAHNTPSRSTHASHSASRPSRPARSSSPPVPLEITPGLSTSHGSDPPSESDLVPTTPATAKKRRSSPAQAGSSAKSGRSGRGNRGGSPELERGDGTLRKRARPSYVYAPLEEELDEDYQPVRRKSGAGNARESVKAKATAGTGSGVKTKGKGKRVLLDSDDEEAMRGGRGQSRGKGETVLLPSDDEEVLGRGREKQKDKGKGKRRDVVPDTEDEEEDEEGIAWEDDGEARRDFVPDTDEEEEDEPIPPRRDKGKGKAPTFIPGTSDAEEDDIPFRRAPITASRTKPNPTPPSVEVVDLLSPDDTSSRRTLASEDLIVPPSDNDYFEEFGSFPLDLLDLNVLDHPPASLAKSKAKAKAAPADKKASPVRPPRQADPGLENLFSSPPVPLARQQRRQPTPSPSPSPSPPPPILSQRCPPLPAPRVCPAPVPAPREEDEFPIQMVDDLPKDLQDFYKNHFRRGADQAKKRSEAKENQDDEEERGGGRGGTGSGRASARGGGTRGRGRGGGGRKKAPSRGKGRSYKKTNYFRKK